MDILTWYRDIDCDVVRGICYIRRAKSQQDIWRSSGKGEVEGRRAGLGPIDTSLMQRSCKFRLVIGLTLTMDLYQQDAFATILPPRHRPDANLIRHSTHVFLCKTLGQP